MEAQIEKDIEELFGRIGWHHYSRAQRKDGVKECYWCKKQPPTKRALVNIWGTVCDVDCCEECYPKNHGCCRDQI